MYVHATLALSQLTLRTVWRFLKKLKIKLPYDPAIPLLGIYPEKTIIQKESCMTMFIATLFTIARTWKQPKCPSTDEWIEKMWHIYTMEYYSAHFLIGLFWFFWHRPAWAVCIFWNFNLFHLLLLCISYGTFSVPLMIFSFSIPLKYWWAPSLDHWSPL